MSHKLSLWSSFNRDDFGLGFINHFLMRNFRHASSPNNMVTMTKTPQTSLQNHFVFTPVLYYTAFKQFSWI